MDNHRKSELNWKFWTIKNKDEAGWLIDQVIYGFYVIAFLYVLSMFIFDHTYLFDVVFLVIFASLLYFTRSRILAILLFIYFLMSATVTFLSFFGIITAGRNIFLAILTLYFSFGAVYAAFKYHKLNK